MNSSLFQEKKHDPNKIFQQEMPSQKLYLNGQPWPRQALNQLQKQPLLLQDPQENQNKNGFNFLLKMAFVKLDQTGEREREREE